MSKDRKDSRDVGAQKGVVVLKDVVNLRKEGISLPNVIANLPNLLDTVKPAVTAVPIALMLKLPHPPHLRLIDI